MIKEAIGQVVEGKDLSPEQARGAMDEIMSGGATPAQIGAYITALRMKGESIDEITASAQVMREKAPLVRAEGDVLDIVGTGGDRSFTFNVSTVSSLVVAAAGVQVAKHGNRSASSKCGSADVLEALGVKLNLTAEQAAGLLRTAGICFMFAQAFHGSMKYAAGPRRELGIRTIFNILGPLANPARANLQLLGVYDAALCQPLAQVLANLGVRRAMVVYGLDGLDEVSLCGQTQVSELIDQRVSNYLLSPEDFGLTPCALEDLRGGDAQENAQIARNILSGETGPKRDMVLLNSAAALYMAGKADGLKAGVEMARELIDSGKAAEKLEELVRVSNSIA
ncbi:anthranilate phosphoribosyltransferase [Ethanoligenens harbinense]|uniref:Anthranilate phosphoribosyltransferase n=1 Tax=Ethanoligenens harbinense (strain DSM 18485 / JCM 12961 / CGMCC 1.5033 / YUAN-3) TaxID=663278 RepID=E6U695_ETHHY|nr:anthranilate phosphoribosyltransferase [Ethanoligenens harbinense]ADU26862.1 anthranilate phosphoribosyltransferase [Ethanoligenens harbinense YUAN-3]AVQ95964.1 anthranilate phosphoribosyltransferase [Ethanoligenens harbinense YUAN-3]AYF38626.1 anthranilate phosphoribosyltransferase [Ethanoligenens harbinense]AYF41372.1 anthranilate phosphoribosyltransferase [Ethanoligenens harbinense]QCN92205.1 anthranilate phosphoribosyltransferase [Ethanoligenens harbinense]